MLVQRVYKSGKIVSREFMTLGYLLQVELTNFKKMWYDHNDNKIKPEIPTSMFDSIAFAIAVGKKILEFKSVFKVKLFKHEITCCKIDLKTLDGPANIDQRIKDLDFATTEEHCITLALPKSICSNWSKELAALPKEH